MFKHFFPKIQFFLKPVLLSGLIGILLLSNVHEALAARSGGRMGGGSFRAPSRSLSAPSRSGGGLSGGMGGGMGFPFIIPFLGFGGGFGSLFSILIVFAIANFVMSAVRNAGGGGGGQGELESDNPPVSVGKIQVGLLATARELQRELNELGVSADTGTPEGRAMLLQEVTLSLLRHPEYWVYGSTESQVALLSAAEAKFNQLALGERSKFTSETLSNVNSQLRQATSGDLIAGKAGELANHPESSGDYILVTLVVASLGRSELSAVNDSSEMRQVLQQVGAIGSDRLLAIEVLWTPQAEGDTLTTDDILAAYPNLKLM
jgi:uncharacterized membrane protein